MNSNLKKSRRQKYQEDHGNFERFWMQGMPTTEIAYILSLSKAQVLKHLGDIDNSGIVRQLPSYDVIRFDDLPSQITRLLSSFAPLCKLDVNGYGLILTPYDPKKDNDEQTDEVNHASISKPASTFVPTICDINQDQY